MSAKIHSTDTLAVLIDLLNAAISGVRFCMVGKLTKDMLGPHISTYAVLSRLKDQSPTTLQHRALFLLQHKNQNCMKN